MDPNSQRLIMGAGGGAVNGKPYVEDVFSTWLYTGNGSTQTITNGIDLAGSGGLVWVKARGSTSFGNVDHALHDSARGVTNSLLSSSNSGQFDQTTSGVTAFNSSGFAIGSGPRYNESPVSYASWTFRKQAKFFDVVTYTGNGSNRTIAHNLGSVPGCIIVKRTDGTGDWQVYHRANTANPETDYLVLNSTAATVDSNTRWNDTLPTSTVFSLGTEATVNASGGTYVAYLFAHDAGGFGDSGNDSVIKCGSFTTDGSGNATVDLGWEPQWVMMKNSQTAGNSWNMHDTMRGYNAASGSSSYNLLFANTSNAEASGAGDLGGVTPTGFTVKSLSSSNSYIYIAIRRGPMKTPTDATKVFSALARTGTGTNPTVVTTGTSPDLLMSFARTASPAPYGTVFFDKLRGISQILQSASTSAEATTAGTFVLQNFLNTGFQTGADFIQGYLNYNASPYAQYALTRAPGFFDVVAYTGTGSATTVSHNLGVVPELLIIKGRNQSTNWKTYYSFTPTTYKDFNLNSASAASNGTYGPGGFPNFESFSTAPTVTAFSVSANSIVINNSGTTYIAYLFASCPGVSKVGSYTGTGTTLSIDCGFTAGARFVLIKRTDSSGDWYVWDTARGIVSGNDPYLLLNSTAVEDTSTDYIDPLNAGFQISSTAPAAINANGGSFLYLAIA